MKRRIVIAFSINALVGTSLMAGFVWLAYHTSPDFPVMLMRLW